MGTSKIWFWPDPGGTVEEIDIGGTLSDLQFNPAPNQEITEGLRGGLATTQFGSRGMVRVIEERFTDAALARKLYALETHLKAGGLIAVAVDSDQAWAGFTTTIPDRGDTTIEIAGHPWPVKADPTMLAGEEIEILGPQPYATREFVTITNISTGNGPHALSESPRFSLVTEGARWALARHRGFWPLLRLPKDQRSAALVTHDHRISYTFDAQLEEAIDVLDAFAGVPDAAVTTTTETDSGFSPEEVNRVLSLGLAGDTNAGGGITNGGAGGGGFGGGTLPGLSDLFKF